MARLVKIAKELNVGTTTIVQHLLDKGFDIENKPTAKVTDAMYAVLLRDFQNSIAIKNQADQLTIGLRHNKGEEGAEEILAADLEAQKKAAAEELKKKEAAEALRQAEEAEKKKLAEAQKAAEEEEKKQKLAGLKKVGNIDLESLKKKPVTKKKEPVKEEKPVVEEKKEEEVVKELIKEEKPVVEEKKEEEVIRAEGRKLEGPKVLGKIDVTKKKKPAAKKKEEKKVVKEVVKEEKPVVEEKKEVVKEEKPVVEEKKEVEKVEKLDPDHIVTKKVILEGPKIVGRIELPEKAKKKPVASSDATTKTRKRKRRRKKKGDESTTGTNNNPQTDNRNKPADNKNNRNKNKKRGDKSSQNQPPEVSRKEIDDKIKATMARLTGGGKSKRSKIKREQRERFKENLQSEESEEISNKLQVTEFVSVSELAGLMNVAVTDVIMACFKVGVIVSINQRLDAEIIDLVASEHNFEVEFISAEEQDEEEDEIEENEEDLIPRSPIVTVMGHVDHGKTSLLDFIRDANVAGGEAGGITQHIGAYEVRVGENNRKITFLDTPGHEAFTAMRARGAKVTDVAVIIIAADDQVMPQTKEAISHALAAGVPIIFAINKIDKDGSNPEKIKEQLANMNLLVEDWGGKYQCQEISAKKGLNIEPLLEKILLEAEMLELKANPKRSSHGVVLEASLDKGRGYVTKILVQAGTLRIGDAVVAGIASGKVKAMFNERGKRIKEAGPSTPVLMLGLNGAPQAGEKFKVMESEQAARLVASKRAQIERSQRDRASKRLSLEEITRRLALGTFKELNLIVKGDMDGSVEALSDALQQLSIDTIQVNIVHRAVGQIIESDVLLAAASDAIIIGFQVRPSSTARKLAEREGVQIKHYSVIYDATDEVKMAIEGMLEPTKEEKITGQVEIREVYKIGKLGNIAGCYVSEGKILRNNKIRVIRDGIVVFPVKEGAIGELGSLKRFKDDVKDVNRGLECGLTIRGYNDLKVGDVVEAYEIIEIRQTLDDYK